MYAKVEDVVKLNYQDWKKNFIVSRFKILIPKNMSGIFLKTNSTKNLKIF